MWLGLFIILVIIVMINDFPTRHWEEVKTPQFINGEPSRLAQMAWQKIKPAQVITLHHSYLILAIGELPVLTESGKIVFAKIQLAYLSPQIAQINTHGFGVVREQSLSDNSQHEDMSQFIASIIASVWQQQQSTYCAVVNLNGNNQQIINPQKDVSDILQTATKHHPHNGKAIFQPRIFYSFSHNLPLIMP